MLNKMLLAGFGLILFFTSVQASWILQNSGLTTIYDLDFPPRNIMTGYACGA